MGFLGSEVSIRGTTSYNSVFTVADVSTDTFVITDTWVADDGASDWDEGSYLEAGAIAGGLYAMAWSISLTENGGAGSNVIFGIYHNSTACPKCRAKRKFANNDYGSVSGHSIATITAGDRIYLSATSDGTNTLTIQFGNLDIHQL